MNTKICRPIPTCFKPDDPCLVKMVGNGRVINSNFAQWSFPASGLVVSGRASMPSYVRNSNATRGIGIGQIETVAANVLRMDYDTATGEYLGALFEGQKTGLTASQGFTAVGAEVVIESTTILAPDGSLTATRVSGIQAQAGDRARSAVAQIVGGQSYNAATWAKGVPGEIGRFYAKRVSGGSAGPTTPINLTFNGQWQRLNLGNHVTEADNVSFAAYVIAGGTSNADTVDLWQGQIETGGLSSTILTPGTQATRQADTMVVNDVASWFNPTGGVFFAKVRAYPGQVFGTGEIDIVRVGSGNSSIRLVGWDTNGGRPRAGVGDGSVVNYDAWSVAQLSSAEWTYLALYYSTSGGSCLAVKVGSGVPVISNVSNGGIYSGATPTTMGIGGRSGGATPSAHIRDIRYQPILGALGSPIADLLNQYAAANS